MKISLNDPRLEEIKYYLEFYFSDEHVEHNEFMKDLIKTANMDGYVSTFSILAFNKMTSRKAEIADLREIAPFAVNFELNETGGLIRKRQRNLNSTVQLLGFDDEGIRNLSEAQYYRFLEVKNENEQFILDNIPIVVTTCNSMMNQKLTGLTFKKVIVDEAAQATEIEILMAAAKADSLVLIGDHKQLGPIYNVEVPKCDSMFSRLMAADFQDTTMLEQCYRLHP